MADAVFEVLLEKVVTSIQDEAHYVHEFPELFKKMKKEILFMQSYIKDVGKVKAKNQNETLKMSVRELRELLYDVEDIIADCELMFHKQQRGKAFCCIMCHSPSLLKFHYQMGKKLSQKNEELVNLKDNLTSYLGTTLNFPKEEHLMGSSQPARYPKLINEAEIVGIDNDSDKIIEWLLQKDGPLKLIGIVGMGGIGKTTLAEKIYNTDNVRKHFDHALMVTISLSVELKEVVKNILRKLNMKEDNSTRNKRELLEEDERGLLEGLRGQLKGKYLLIFDDIWETTSSLPWWESLKTALPQRNDGSCVLFTTRQETVVKSMGALKKHIHRPQLLSKQNGWLLFTKIAFANESGHCPDSELENIGKAIVTKCGGLPLAIKVVGGVLLGKGHSVLEWRMIYERLNEEVHKKNDLVLSTLQLSYEELPMHLKPCMLCVAFFCEDSIICDDALISWWIGEGFVRPRDGKTAFQVGEDCWDELISRGLLLGVDMYFSEEKFVTCRVHDMIREMIVEIAKEEKFMTLVGNANPSSCLQSRRVVITEDDRDSFFKKVDKKPLQLRTLVVENIIESKVFFSKLYPFKWLRVLILSFKMDSDVDDDEDLKKLHHLLDGIGSFRHLTYLRIENSKMDSLPDSIKNLRSLQILILDKCPHLKWFPTQLTSLENLTLILLYECYSLEYFPKGIGNLSNLEALKFTPVRTRSGVREGCRLSELKMLTQLQWLNLEIRLEDQLEYEELRVLSELKQLKCLTIGFVEEGKTDEQNEQLLKKVDYELPPCPQIQELILKKFPGKETPVWLNPTTFPNLRFLYVSKANITQMCPGFFQKTEENEFWRLEVLHLFYLEEMEEEWGRMHKAMLSLRLLLVARCPKLKSLPCDVEKSDTWRKDEKEMD